MFCEASFTLIVKPDKTIREKENSKPISLMGIETEILNQISRSNPAIYEKDNASRPRECIPGVQSCFNAHKSINVFTMLTELRRKPNTIISVGAEKSFDTI